jgi:hypothetical protein
MTARRWRVLKRKLRNREPGIPAKKSEQAQVAATQEEPECRPPGTEPLPGETVSADLTVDACPPPPMYSEAPERRLSPEEQEQWDLVVRAEEQCAVTSEPGASWGAQTERAINQPADPLWPPPVWDAWWAYRRAQTSADYLIDAVNFDEAESAPAGSDADVAYWKANDARHEAELAYERYSGAWIEWQFGPQPPAPVREAWNSYREAQAHAESVTEICSELQEAGPVPPGSRADSVYLDAYIARHEAEGAYDDYRKAWHEWQRGQEMSTDHGDFEADE